MSTILIITAVTTVMILINALYVAAEFAAVSARRSRISQQAMAGNRLARMLDPILTNTQRLDTYVAACQLGITASSLVLGYYGQSAIARAIAPLFSRLGGMQDAAAQSVAATVVLLALTTLQVVFGELVPKSVALRYPERLALLTVIPMRWSMILFRPAIALFNGAGNLILKALGIPPADHHLHVHSPEEIELLMAESAKGGLLEPDERQLLRNALHMGDITAAETMVPRTRLVAAAIDTPLRDLLNLATASGFTRIPVYQATIDNIIGIVHLKDLFQLYVQGGDGVAAIVRQVPFVPETKPAVEVWNELRQAQSYVAIVFDEFGGTAGMITTEDLLEEIFGEVQDEYDEEEHQLTTDASGRIRLAGDKWLAEINETFNLKLAHEDVNTIGGLVMATLGRIPEVGDEVTLGPATIRVEAIEGAAVQHVSLKLAPRASDAPSTEAEGEQ